VTAEAEAGLAEGALSAPPPSAAGRAVRHLEHGFLILALLAAAALPLADTLGRPFGVHVPAGADYLQQVVLWLAFGKEFLGAIAFGVPFEVVAGQYETLPSVLLRASSELGIGVVESLGTLAFLPDELRLGVDHLYSLAQLFPDGMLGLEIDWPVRIVRVSTEAFVSSDMLDIPPGFIGQMWLDFRLFGPVLWGIGLGLQVGLVQWAYERTNKALGAAALGGLLTFVIALPVNSGSFDFTFSIDIFILLIVLWGCLSFTPVSADSVSSAELQSGARMDAVPNGPSVERL